MPPAVLSDMRKVYRGTLKKKPTHGQRQLQKMFEQDTDKFLHRLSIMEKAQKEARSAKEALMAKKGGKEAEAVQEVDESTAVLSSLIEKVLKEAQGGTDGS